MSDLGCNQLVNQSINQLVLGLVMVGDSVFVLCVYGLVMVSSLHPCPPRPHPPKAAFTLPHNLTMPPPPAPPPFSDRVRSTVLASRAQTCLHPQVGGGASHATPCRFRVYVLGLIISGCIVDSFRV